MNNRLLLYKVDKDTSDIISEKYNKNFEILDVTDCFTDLLVLRAEAVFVDPDELYDQEIYDLVDIFTGEENRTVYFTSQPSHPELFENMKWNLYQYAQPKEVKSVAKKYSNEDIEKMLDDLVSSDSSFYKSRILNYIGKSSSEDYYTEVVSQWLLNKSKQELETIFSVGPKVSKEEKYSSKPIHTKEDVAFKEGSNRDEENIAKKLMKQGRIGDYLVEDYQVPVNRVNVSPHGKVDIILSKDGKTILGELKDADSKESLLRSVVEIATYYSKIARNANIKKRFMDSYSGADKFVPAVLLFEGSKPYQDYHSDEMPNVRALAKKLGVEIIEIGPPVKGREDIKNAEFFLK